MACGPNKPSVYVNPDNNEDELLIGTSYESQKNRNVPQQCPRTKQPCAQGMGPSVLCDDTPRGLGGERCADELVMVVSGDSRSELNRQG